MTHRFRRTTSALAAIVGMSLSTLALAGCANDSFAQDYAANPDQGYVAGDGSMQVIAKASRGKPIAFSGKTDSGDQWTSDQHAGEVIVVNFWYASCPPCRAEARDLEAAYQQYQSDNVTFVGVNVYDQAATAQSFNQEFGISYPSILDVDDAAVRLAFSDNVSPQAIPSTLILDREGRVAAVIRGVANPSVLNDMIHDVVAE